MKLISCLLFFLSIEMHDARKKSSQKFIRIPLTTTREKMNSTNARSIFLEDLGNMVGEITIGRPRQNFNVTFDTGSPHLFVFSSKYDTCDPHSGIVRRKQKLYNHESSVLFRPVNTPQQNPKADLFPYGSGWVFGFWANDVVKLDGKKIRTKFLEVTKTTEQRAEQAMNGLMGMWYRPTEKNLVSIFCDKLQAPHKFSYYLPKFYHYTNKRKGELLFCGENESKYVAGTMKYIKEAEPYGKWYIQLDSVRLEKIDAYDKLISSKTLAIVDTGTNGIVGPAENLKTFFETIKPYVIDENIYQQVQCQHVRNLPILTFQAQGEKFFLTPFEYTMKIQGSCVVFIMPLEGATEWILGEPFLRKHYTIFDMDNHTIGIGKSNG